MALIKCPECGKDISDTLKSCIHCGFVLRKTEEKTNDDAVLKSDNADKKTDEHSNQTKKITPKKSNSKKILTIVISTLLIMGLACLVILVIIPSINYNKATEFLKNGEYNQAVAAFDKAIGYKDSEKQILEAKYLMATKYQDNNENGKAAILFGSIADYKDSKEKSLIQWEILGVRKTISEGPLAVKSDGTVLYSFGCVDDYGAWVEDIASWTDIASISFRNYIVGIKNDGTIIGTASDSKIKKMFDDAKWTDIVKVTGNENHTIGIKIDGTVVMLHHHTSHSYKEFCEIEEWTDIVDISVAHEFSGDEHIVGLKADGTVVALGENEYGQCDVSEWTDIVGIATGRTHTVGLKKDGTVVAVGKNDAGQCTVSGWKGIKRISAGYTETIGLKEDGTVLCVGSRDDKMLDVSSWTDVVDITSEWYYTLGLKSDGTILVAKYNYVLNELHGISNWKDIRVASN